jgi:hypothetical protein
MNIRSASKRANGIITMANGWQLVRIAEIMAEIQKVLKAGA